MMSFLNRHKSKWVKSLIKIIQKNSEIEGDAIATNIRRIFHLAAIAVPIGIYYINLFLFFTPEEYPNTLIWRSSLIKTHSVMLVFMLASGLISRYIIRKKIQKGTLAKVVQYIAISVILIFGVVISAIDQWVTPSVTPFFVACTITAMVFLLRPAVIIPIYLLTYILFFKVLSLAQPDSAINISNMINGFTSISLGICISFMLWLSYSRNLQQKWFIEKQKSELQEKNKKLTYLAAYDSMTELFNRREFEKAVDREIVRMKRYQYDSCILITDVDFFKKVNDKYGHPGGDEILKQLPYVLKSHLREIDVISRWGGEEFIILLPDTPVKGGVHVAELLREKIEKQDFMINQNHVKITASFGVAPLLHKQDEPFRHSYEHADKALYRAKNKGRNRVEFAVQSLPNVETKTAL